MGVNRHAKGTPYRRAKGTPFVADCMKTRCFFVRLTGPFLRPGLITPRRRALPRSSMAAGHRRGRGAACLTAASTAPGSDKAGHGISRGLEASALVAGLDAFHRCKRNPGKNRGQRHDVAGRRVLLSIV